MDTVLGGVDGSVSEPGSWLSLYDTGVHDTTGGGYTKTPFAIFRDNKGRVLRMRRYTSHNAGSMGCQENWIGM